MKNILNRILGKGKSSEPSAPELNRWYSYGFTHPDESEIIFTNPARKIRRTIVDKYGNILGFPGVENEDAVVAMLDSGSVQPVIRFQCRFSRCPNGHLLVAWEIQPDGRYWMDEDGYGMTPEEEIYLYTTLDEYGRFTGPFRLERPVFSS